MSRAWWRPAAALERYWAETGGTDILHRVDMRGTRFGLAAVCVVMIGLLVGSARGSTSPGTGVAVTTSGGGIGDPSWYAHESVPVGSPAATAAAGATAPGVPSPTRSATGAPGHASPGPSSARSGGTSVAAAGGVVPQAAPDAPGAWIDLSHLRLVSYRPGANGPNPMTSTPINAGQLDFDLSRVASLNANAVRLSIDYRAAPGPDMQGRFETFLEIARRHGLRVQLTLFDQYTGYDIAWSQQWVHDLLGPFASDRRVAFLEVQNEIDPGNASAMSWAAAMIPYVRALAGGIPVTISGGGWCAALPRLAQLQSSLAASPPDFWDIHFYCDPAAAYATFRDAMAMAAPLPLIIGETGYSTVADSSSTPGATYGTQWQETEQARFFRVVEDAAASSGLGAAAAWVDSDISRTTCQGCAPRELHFGCFRLDGSPKPAAEVITDAFRGARGAGDLNLGFETDVGGYPAAWSIVAQKSATFGHDGNVAHSGSWSARIANATRDASGTAPSWTLSIPRAVVPQQTYTASAWARGLSLDGPVSVFLVWKNTEDQTIGYVGSTPLPSGDASQWTNLSISGVAPDGAAFAQVSLSSLAAHGTAWFDDVNFQ